jgi:hypothetical protein
MADVKSLADFVAETLSQIVAGVRKAQAVDHGEYVSPTGIMTSGDHAPKGKYFITQARNIVQMVEFDVAVTVVESANVEAGGRISVLSIGIGGKADTGSENTSVSRIRFSVPVAMPEAAHEIGFAPKN